MVRVHHCEAGVGLIIGHGRHIRYLGQLRPGEAGHVPEAGGGEAADHALSAANQDVVLANAQSRGATKKDL